MGLERHQAPHGATVVSDDELLSPENPIEIAAELVANLANTDVFTKLIGCVGGGRITHVSHCNTAIG